MARQEIKTEEHNPIVRRRRIVDSQITNLVGSIAFGIGATEVTRKPEVGFLIGGAILAINTGRLVLPDVVRSIRRAASNNENRR